jgi:exodeoxyribonuclease VII small subunit
MAKKPQPVPKTFEEGVRELETILSEMEAGQVGLEESLTRYERGAFLIRHCRSVLNAAQTQIEAINKGADGGVVSGGPVEIPANERSEATAAEVP